MNMLDMISEPVLFAQESYEHARKVHQIVKRLPLLVDAFLSRDYQQMGIIQEEIAQTRDETVRIKLSLYDRIKDMHFHSPGAYAFSQYLAGQDGMAGASLELADVLTLRRAGIPPELQADFRALAAQVIDVCETAMMPAEVLLSEAEAIPSEEDLEKAHHALRGVADSRKQVRHLGMTLLQHVTAGEGLLGWADALFLDKCCAAMQKLAQQAEHAGDHLHLIFPQA
jgi:uncharacterized protein Yka (UPF0111/DUF47 family)